MTIEDQIENLERELVRAQHRNRRLMQAIFSLVAGVYNRCVNCSL